MKHNTLFTLPAIVIILITAFAFNTDKNYTNDFYAYTGTTNRLIQPGLPTSLVSIEINSNTKWDLTTTTAGAPNGAYLRGIIFNEEFDTDGGADGELTLQEAIDAVRSYYIAYSTLPADGTPITVCNANIIIKRSDSNN